MSTVKRLRELVKQRGVPDIIDISQAGIAAKLPLTGYTIYTAQSCKKSQTILQSLPLFPFLFIDYIELLFSNCAVNQAW